MTKLTNLYYCSPTTVTTRFELGVTNSCTVYCYYSNVSITTRHKSQSNGTKIEYDHSGKLKSKSACARQVKKSSN